MVDGITIPEGMVVQANLWDLHYDEQHWGPNTEQFRPSRFDPDLVSERHSMAWMPFGGGPRQCIGLRFACLQIKLTMVKLLQKFSFSPSEELPRPLKLVEGATIMPANGMPICCTPLVQTPQYPPAFNPYARRQSVPVTMTYPAGFNPYRRRQSGTA